MSSLIFVISGLFFYGTLVFANAKNLFNPSAIFCLMWFSSAALADFEGLKNFAYQEQWEIETYFVIYAAGIAFAIPGYIFRAKMVYFLYDSRPALLYRCVFGVLTVLSILAVIMRYAGHGFGINADLENGSDLKSQIPEAIPFINYFELMTPFLTLFAIYELYVNKSIDRNRRIYLIFYVVYSVILYSIFLSFSRGLLLIVFLGVLFLLNELKQLNFKRILIFSSLCMLILLVVTYFRISSESLVIGYLGDDYLESLFSPIYTYIVFGFENLNKLVRGDFQKTYFLYSLKPFLWIFLKGEYLGGDFNLIEIDTEFFNSRTFIYAFYHDLGIIGCILYPFFISVVTAVFYKTLSNKYKQANVVVLMSMQKALFFGFFGNYFFGELVIIFPYIVVWVLALFYQGRVSFGRGFNSNKICNENSFN